MSVSTQARPELVAETDYEGDEIVGILDAGSQYGKVIDRRIREINVATEVLPLDTRSEDLKKYRALVISGGPGSVYDKNCPKIDPKVLELGVPILGICYGMQLMNLQHGGKVEKTSRREDGQMMIKVEPSRLYQDLPSSQLALLTHGDTVTEVAPNFKVTARCGNIIAGIECEEKKLYGVQFHPEVDLTEHGKAIFKNFFINIAGLHGTYTMEDREHTAIKHIREIVSDDPKKKVLCLCSGGVDSTVCAALMTKALGPDRVHALHIDNGFMRKDESKKVKDALAILGLDLKVIDGSETFYNATTEISGRKTFKLKNTTHPEDKRKIIGDTFMTLTQTQILNLKEDPENIFVVQGTLRPDLIESASAMASSIADAIKTHHNDTELVRKLRAAGRVIEPLKDYHKDEARALGISLGIPHNLVWRQPFPGPGLAIRILCQEKVPEDFKFEEISKKVREIVADAGRHLQLENSGILKDLENIRIDILPVLSVGVQGDCRSYRYVCGVSGTRNWDLLFLLAGLIPQMCHDINRVVYIFGEPLGNLVPKITPTFLIPEVIRILQEADDIVTRHIIQDELEYKLSQVPVVLVPLPMDGEIRGMVDARSIVLRPFVTNDFMTGVPARPNREFTEQWLLNVVDEISKLSGIARVMYDLTSKPPGTTEWE